MTPLKYQPPAVAEPGSAQTNRKKIVPAVKNLTDQLYIFINGEKSFLGIECYQEVRVNHSIRSGIPDGTHI